MPHVRGALPGFMSLLCRTGRGSHVNGRSGMRGYRDVFNSAPTIVGPPLRAKNYSISGPLASEPVLGKCPSGANQALERMGLGTKTHPESLSEICNGEPTTYSRRKHKACSSGITEKEQPKGDAAFSSQHVTANQRKGKRKREREKPACRVEASSVKQHTARKGGIVSKPSLN